MKQAMIFAAGLGTRLKPLTDTMPKALVCVGGKPLLWHVVTRLKAAGYERIVVNVHHFAPQIVDYLRENRDFGIDIRVSDESECLLDTGGGIRKALPLLDADSPVLIHNVDILSNVDLTTDFLTPGADAVLLVSRRQTQRYLLFDNDMRLRGWTNVATGEVRGLQPSLSPSALHKLAFSGIHVLAPTVYAHLAAMPERFGIMDFYLNHCQRLAFFGHEPRDLRLLDVGKLDTLEQAEHFVSQAFPHGNHPNTPTEK